MDLCVSILEEIPGQPFAEFVNSGQMGRGGDSLPFQLRIVKNGWVGTGPSDNLIARVIPENPGSDKEDIFPIVPPTVTDGVRITQNEEIVDMSILLD